MFPRCSKDVARTQTIVMDYVERLPFSDRPFSTLGKSKRHRHDREKTTLRPQACPHCAHTIILALEQVAQVFKNAHKAGQNRSSQRGFTR